MEESSDLIIQTSFQQDSDVLADQRYAFPTEDGAARFANKKDLAGFADRQDGQILAGWECFDRISRAGGGFTWLVPGFQRRRSSAVCHWALDGTRGWGRIRGRWGRGRRQTSGCGRIIGDVV